MDLKKLTILFLLIGTIGLCHYVSASQNGTYIANKSGTVTLIEAEIDVVTDVLADMCWYEINLDKDRIDFGAISRNISNESTYKISARGTTNITITPKLKKENDIIFSNLYFSRTGSLSSYKPLGNYSMTFNLGLFSREWVVIGSYDQTELLNGSSKKGLQYIRLDLSNLDEVIPYDLEDQRNTVVFSAEPEYGGCIFDG